MAITIDEDVVSGIDVPEGSPLATPKAEPQQQSSRQRGIILPDSAFNMQARLNAIPAANLDQAAQAEELASRLGIPSVVAGANLQECQARADAQEQARLAKESPAFRDWMLSSEQNFARGRAVLPEFVEHDRIFQSIPKPEPVEDDVSALIGQAVPHGWSAGQDAMAPYRKWKEEQALKEKSRRGREEALVRLRVADARRWGDMDYTSVADINPETGEAQDNPFERKHQRFIAQAFGYEAMKELNRLRQESGDYAWSDKTGSMLYRALRKGSQGLAKDVTGLNWFVLEAMGLPVRGLKAIGSLVGAEGLANLEVPFEEASSMMRQLYDQLDQELGSYKEEEVGTLAKFGLSFVESIPQMLPQIASAVFTASPASLRMNMPGAPMALKSADDVMRKQLMDWFNSYPVRDQAKFGAAAATAVAGAQIFGSLYGDARLNGADMAQAAGAALGDATVQSVMENISFRRMFDIWQARGWRNLGKSIVEAGLTEFATEALQQYPDEFFAWIANAGTRGNETAASLIDRLPEITSEAIQSGLIGAAWAPLLGFGGIRGLARKERMLQQNLELFEALDNSARGSKLREKLPQAYADAVNYMLKDGPVTDIYVSPEAVRRAALATDQDALQLAQTMGVSEEEWAKADETGADLQIPLATWQTKVAGTDAGLHLKQAAKTSPDAMTLAEAEKERNLYAMTLGDALATIQANQALDDELSGILEPIKGVLMATDSGFTEQQAETQLLLMKANAVAWAKIQTNDGKPTTPAEFLRAHLPQVRRVDAEGNVVATTEQQAPGQQSKELNQFIGEQGAKRLDEAEKTTRLADLDVARQMETAGKDAAAVKLATGWERGKDGKWRYETPDTLFKKSWLKKNYKPIEEGGEPVVIARNIGTVINPEIKKAYPEIKNISLYLTVDPSIEKYHGGFVPYSYNLAMNTWIKGSIDINARSIEQAEMMLNHEIQHFIQWQEGFASGGNPEGFETDEQGLVEIDGKKLTPIKAYKNLAGETEARNASKRMGMTEEERRASLAASTEDVAREDQILLGARREESQVATEFKGAGPSPDDSIIGSPVLYQVQNLQEWEENTRALMKDMHKSDAEIEDHIQGIYGQLKLIEATSPEDRIGANLAAQVVGAGQATQKKKNKGIPYSGPVRSNEDDIYRISFDASSMCVKRLGAAATQKEVERRIGRPLTTAEATALVALMQANGKAAPCLYCYVEGNRKKAVELVGDGIKLIEQGESEIPGHWKKGRRANAIAAMKEYRDAGMKPSDIHWEYVLDPAEAFTSEAIAAREKYPNIYTFLNLEAASTKQNKIKLYEEYTNQLLDLSDDNIELLNGFAGVRFFSSSDFQVEHIVDLAQAMSDMELKKIKSHAYTKVMLYVDVFGDTHQKINLSCFAKEDKDGNIIADTAQGWNWEEAKKRRKAHPDCGTVLVASSDKIVRWAMHQDWIDYIIPYHYSGNEKKYWGPAGYQDFSMDQVEKFVYPDKTPVGVPKGEYKTVNALPENERSEYALRKCFNRKAYPVKLEAVFTDIAKSSASNTSKKKLAKERWEQMVASGEFSEEAINPNYWAERLEAGWTTEDKPMFPHEVKKVRMYEIADPNDKNVSTIKGISNERASRIYLEMCLHRKNDKGEPDPIVPVFPTFMFKEELFAELDAKWKKKIDGLTGEKREKKIQEHRSAQTKLATEKWREFVEKGEIDYSMIDLEMFKFKKDYARTDTAFQEIDASQMHLDLAKDALEDVASTPTGLKQKYAPNMIVAGQLEQLINYAKENGIENIGIEAIKALVEQKHPVSAITGGPELPTRYGDAEVYTSKAEAEGRTLQQTMPEPEPQTPEQAQDAEYFAAIERGDKDAVQAMINAKAEAMGFGDAIPEQTEAYAIRTKPSPKKTIKVYKVFTLAPDGAPTALFVNGTEKLPQGVWLDAQDAYHFQAESGAWYVPSTQNPYTEGGKTGGGVKIPSEEVRQELIARGFLPKGSKAEKVTALAYRPGWHAGTLPFFPQGGKKVANPDYKGKETPDVAKWADTPYPNVHRYNQVVFECEMAFDEDYNAEAQATKDGDLEHLPVDGSYYFATNPLTRANPNLGAWVISGSLKINRALTKEEADKLLTDKGMPIQQWEGGTYRKSTPEEKEAALDATFAEKYDEVDDKGKHKNPQFKDRETYQKWYEKQAKAYPEKLAKFERGELKTKPTPPKPLSALVSGWGYESGPLDLASLGYEGPKQEAARKTLAPITYDENGQIIPLSKRFDPDNPSVLYQKSPVPEDPLVAVHNISAPALVNAAKLGGLPVPSIGITKAESQYSGFGDIFLIGTKDMVDPATTPVFNRDAYTARFPKSTYEPVKQSKIDEFRSQYKNAFKDYKQAVEIFGADNAIYSAEQKMRLGHEPKEAAYSLSREKATELAFLDSKGIDFEPVYVKHDKETSLGSLSPEVQELVKNKGWKTDSDVQPSDMPEITAVFLKALENGNYSEFEKNLEIGHIKKQNGTLSLGECIDLVGAAIKDKELYGKTVLDKKATYEKLEQAVKPMRGEYRAWVDSLVLDKYSEPVIQVGRKKMPITLENVVKAMTSKTVRNKEQTLGFGTGEMRAATAKQLKTMEDYDKFRDSIVDELVGYREKKKLDEALDDFRRNVDVGFEYKWESSFEKWDDMSKALADAAKKKGNAKKALATALQKYDFTMRDDYYSDLALDFGVQVIDMLRNGLATYMEAKPQRAVKLDEFLGAVVPNDIPADARKVLQDNGIEIMEYKRDNEEDRKAKVSQLSRMLSGSQDKDVLFQKIRGTFSFTQTQKIITLFNGNADLSTFAHELGHFFFNNMREMIESGQAPEQIARDYQTLQDYAQSRVEEWYNKNEKRAHGGRSLDQLTESERSEAEWRAREEVLAEGWMTYLKEGKAPSDKLKGVFRRFRQWLVSIYKALRHQGFQPINPDVRAVFDRMLASEAECEAAAARHAASDAEAARIDEIGQAMLTAQEQERLKKARINADDDSKEASFQDALKAYWSATKEAEQKHDAIKREVESRPHFAAMLEAIAAGGINRQSIVDELGEEDAKALAKKRPGLVRKEGGVDINQVGVNQGYEDLSWVDEILDGPTVGEAIKEEMEAWKKQREQEIRREMRPEGVEPGDPAYYNDDRLTALLLEATAMQRAAGRKTRTVGNAAAVHEWARRILDDMPMRQAINIGNLSRAEARAAGEAATLLAKGDKQGAADAKRRQAISHAMVLEAMQLRKLRQGLERAMVRWNRHKIQTQDQWKWQEQLRAMAQRYSIGGRNKFAPDRPQELASFRDFVKAYDDESVNGAPPFPEWLLNEDVPEKVSAGQYRDIAYAMKWLSEGMAPEEAQMVSDALKGMSLLDAVTEGVTSLQNSKNEFVYKDEGTLAYKAQMAWNDLFAGLDNAQYIFMAADGYKEIGKRSNMQGFHSRLFQHIKDALSRTGQRFRDAKPELERLAKIRSDFCDRFEKLYGKRALTINGIPTPDVMQEIGRRHWTAEMIWSMARNRGNEGNLKTLRNGLELEDDQIDALTSILTAEEWQAVADECALISSSYEDADRAFRSVYGMPMPDKVQPDPFTATTADGSTIDLPGWYFPISVDSALSPEIGDKQEVSAMKDSPDFTALGPSIRRGFTHARTGTGKATALRFAVFEQALWDQWRMIEMGPIVRDLDRLMRNKQWRHAFEHAFGPRYYEQMRQWLKYTARPSQEKQDVVNRTFSNFRSASTIFSLGLNVQTFLRQFGGYPQAIPDVGAGWIVRGLGKAFLSPRALWQEVNRLSPMMADRDKSFVRELREYTAKYKESKVTIAGHDFTRQDVQECAMALVTLGDRMTTYPIWWGAYQRAIQKHAMTQEKAVAYADGIVSKTQAVASEADINAWQRDNGFKRLLSMFMSESLRKGSRMRYWYRAWRKGQVPFSEYAWHFSNETFGVAILFMFMKAVLTSSVPDKDDVAWAVFDEALGPIPMLNQLSSVMQYNTSPSSMSALKGFDLIGRTFQKGKKWAENPRDSDAIEGMFKAAVDMAAFTAGTGNVRRIYETGAEGWKDVSTGKSQNPFRLFLKGFDKDKK